MIKTKIRSILTPIVVYVRVKINEISALLQKDVSQSGFSLGVKEGRFSRVNSASVVFLRNGQSYAMGNYKPPDSC